MGDTVKHGVGWMVDKRGWPSGPWMDEPDYVQFQDEATGYVGVPDGHPF